MKIGVHSLVMVVLVTFFYLTLNDQARAGDVKVKLPNNAYSRFLVVDETNNHLFGVSSDNGRVGIGVELPTRLFHVLGNDNIAKFETSSTASRALLDLDAPDVATNNLSRLSWRSNSSTGATKQFGAVDMVYLNKTNGSEQAHMAFSTMHAGTFKETMRVGWNRVGIGTDQPNWKLDVVENLSSGHTARFFNSSSSATAGVLRIRVNRTVPSTGNDFITFERDNGHSVGRITGNNSGGVTYSTSGGDFAEYLPLREIYEQIEAGDIVGLFAGSISRTTQGTDRLRVVSTAPAIVGNMPEDSRLDLHRVVAFLGQVPVKVRGAVQAGDYIVPSGLNDGTGLAVNPDDLTPSQYGQIVGVAWESSSEESVKPITIEVGMHTAASHLAELHEQKDRQIQDLVKTTQSLQTRLETLEQVVRSLASEPSLLSLDSR